MKHIGGYPGRYERGVRELILREQPQLFISRHSYFESDVRRQTSMPHMTLVLQVKQGWHKEWTLIRFVIEGKKKKKIAEVIELGKRV